MLSDSLCTTWYLGRQSGGYLLTKVFLMAVATKKVMLL